MILKSSFKNNIPLKKRQHQLKCATGPAHEKFFVVI
ncbi:hypothetical protein P618_200117 [Holospora obtusa F1]|uniref:Uncharacterized protein n=1 Tax=Holospora obtusa F1 TaxID=1399147 RepID=W6TFB9_HOLOB|nr:hypothetical protein P618_200117 [Holospora obtusa F1]